MRKRVFVEKKLPFAIEAKTLQHQVFLLCMVKTPVRVINIYDLSIPDARVLSAREKSVFADSLTDVFNPLIDLKKHRWFASEYLPNQFDPRAKSAAECLKLINPQSAPSVTTGKLYLFSKKITPKQLAKIKHWLINKAEMQEKNLGVFGQSQKHQKEQPLFLNNFSSWTTSQLAKWKKETGLVLSVADLEHVQKYFRSEKRDPNAAEILLLNAYWSDHCRHTTFRTVLKRITFAPSGLAPLMRQELQKFRNFQKKASSSRKTTLMDITQMTLRQKQGEDKSRGLEIGGNVNACGIFVSVKKKGEFEKWLVQFKNETHNHPTEIEPFGGASTCLGGAVRDVLTGRCRVYQGVRVSGAGNPNEKIIDTWPNKLPQRLISKRSAAGFAAYGNQIGIPTTLVEEIVHPKYKAKHMELGFVVGACPAKQVNRQKPVPGDVVILVGGDTGRDGINGAAGSSQEHSSSSLKSAVLEVQKGDPVEGHKLLRLFSTFEFASLVKCTNDLGAGGLAVGGGELADGITLTLDKVPLKRPYLNGHEILLSESQERMLVVTSAKNTASILKLARNENVAATVVGKVTTNPKLEIVYQKKKIVSLKRSFLNTNGATRTASVVVRKQTCKPWKVSGRTLEEKFLRNLSDPNVTFKGKTAQIFDNTIGSTSVLVPYGGETQLTRTHVSVHKIPVGNKKSTLSTMVAYGFDPYLASQSPFVGAVYAVVDAITKIVSHGGAYKKTVFSFQEYFGKLGGDPTAWGEPLAALLGANFALRALNSCALGGKDSMSGTYKKVHVPPTFIAFGLTTVSAKKVIGSEFKKSGNYIYLFKHKQEKSGVPDFSSLTTIWKTVSKKIEDQEVVSAWPVGLGGVAGGLFQMALGQNLGFKVRTKKLNFFDRCYGDLIVESTKKITEQNCFLLGVVTKKEYVINGENIKKSKAFKFWSKIPAG